MRGVASVVTGGGKTFFAFLCIQEFRKKYMDGRVVIVVPTVVLLDQWYISLRDDLGVAADDIACYSGQESTGESRVVNIIVINTGRRLVRSVTADTTTLLIVDECHRAGSPENSKALRGSITAALGLSATPRREYDSGFEERVVPVLGDVIFEYDYKQAHEDGIIVPFTLVNVKVDLLPHEQAKYDRLTKRGAILFRQRAAGDAAIDAQLKRLFQMRASIGATATLRIPVAAKIVEQNRGVRTIVFHERVSAADAIHGILKLRNHSVCLYHSRMSPEVRRDNLRLFRNGIFDVLISCRALDEGMNIPETSVAVIASSTASLRQRIQRLGRVLRPASNKQHAIVHTLYATPQERRRLQREAEQLDGTARVTWAATARVSEQ